MRVAVCENGTGGDAEERLRQRHRRERLGFVGGPHGRSTPTEDYRGQQRRDPAGPRSRTTRRNTSCSSTPTRSCWSTPSRAWSRSWTTTRRPGSPAACSSRRMGRSGLAVPLPGDRHRARPGHAARRRLEAPAAYITLPKPESPGRAGLGRRGEHDPAADRRSRRSGCWTRACTPTLMTWTSACGRRGPAGRVVCPAEPDHPPRRGHDRGGDRTVEASTARLLVPGPTPILPQEPRGLVHGAG